LRGNGRRQFWPNCRCSSRMKSLATSLSQQFGRKTALDLRISRSDRPVLTNRKRPGASFSKVPKIFGCHNRPFATNDHAAQNPAMLESKLIIIPAIGHQNKGKSSFTGSGLFVLMSQYRNKNELPLQRGGFCAT